MKTNGASARALSLKQNITLVIIFAVICVGTTSARGASPRPLDTTAVDAQSLKFGMSTALSGPAAQLGINMRHGILAAFDEAMAKNRLPSKTLKLIALDDGYEPARTAPNMHRLTGEHGVLAVVGNVGTPTAITAIPIAQHTKTPFFGAFTGASALGKQGRSISSSTTEPATQKKLPRWWMPWWQKGSSLKRLGSSHKTTVTVTTDSSVAWRRYDDTNPSKYPAFHTVAIVETHRKSKTDSRIC